MEPDRRIVIDVINISYNSSNKISMFKRKLLFLKVTFKIHIQKKESKNENSARF